MNTSGSSEMSGHWVRAGGGGLLVALEELLGADVDVIDVAGLKPKHRGLLAEAITL